MDVMLHSIPYWLFISTYVFTLRVTDNINFIHVLQMYLCAHINFDNIIATVISEDFFFLLLYTEYSATAL